MGGMGERAGLEVERGTPALVLLGSNPANHPWLLAMQKPATLYV